MRQTVLKTADGVCVDIALIYLGQTTAGILEGGRGFVWQQCVDKAPERIRHMWQGPPVLMLPPVGLDRTREQPPRWRVAARLENWSPLRPYDPKLGMMEGSHLTLIFFRDQVFHRPLDRIVARAVRQVMWLDHAEDWGF